MYSLAKPAQVVPFRDLRMVKKSSAANLGSCVRSFRLGHLHQKLEKYKIQPVEYAHTWEMLMGNAKSTGDIQYTKQSITGRLDFYGNPPLRSFGSSVNSPARQ